MPRRHRPLPVLMPGLALLLAVAGCALGPRMAAAQASDWTVSLALPLSLRFTHDPQASEPGVAAMPAGLSATALSPWHVGLGVAGYRTRFTSAAFPFGGRTVDLRLAELLASYGYQGGWLALGYGLGRARFRPVTQVSGSITQDFLASDAQEWLVLAAFRLGARWDAALGFHLLQVKARFVTNGSPASGALDAQLLTAGAARHF